MTQPPCPPPHCRRTAAAPAAPPHPPLPPPPPPPPPRARSDLSCSAADSWRGRAGGGRQLGAGGGSAAAACARVAYSSVRARPVRGDRVYGRGTVGRGAPRALPDIFRSCEQGIHRKLIMQCTCFDASEHSSYNLDGCAKPFSTVWRVKLKEPPRGHTVAQPAQNSVCPFYGQSAAAGGVCGLPSCRCGPHMSASAL